jgi:hypothetical protein
MNARGSGSRRATAAGTLFGARAVTFELALRLSVGARQRMPPGPQAARSALIAPYLGVTQDRMRSSNNRVRFSAAAQVVGVADHPRFAPALSTQSCRETRMAARP